MSPKPVDKPKPPTVDRILNLKALKTTAISAATQTYADALLAVIPAGELKTQVVIRLGILARLADRAIHNPPIIAKAPKKNQG